MNDIRQINKISGVLNHLDAQTDQAEEKNSRAERYHMTAAENSARSVGLVLSEEGEEADFAT